MAKKKKKKKKKKTKRRSPAPKRRSRTKPASVTPSCGDAVSYTPTNIPWTDDDKGYIRALGYTAANDLWVSVQVRQSTEQLRKQFDKLVGIRPPSREKVLAVITLALDPSGQLHVDPTEWLPFRTHEGWLFAKRSEFPDGGLIGINFSAAVAALNEVIRHPIRIDWMDEDGTRRVAPLKSTDRLPPGVFTPLQQAILLRLYEDSANTPMLVHELNRPRRTLQDALKPLVDAGLVANLPGLGYYRTDAKPKTDL